jgi:FixJ family two-component response regulator
MMTPSPCTILIIDDDEAVCKALKSLFSVKGYACETFNDPHAFLNYYSTSTSSAGKGCLVIDIWMPTLNGLELQAALKARHHPWPIIFISGHADKALILQAKQAGAFDVIMKPFDNRHLIERIQAAVAQP